MGKRETLVLEQMDTFLGDSELRIDTDGVVELSGECSFVVSTDCPKAWDSGGRYTAAKSMSHPAVKLPGHTCPAIDKLKRIIRKHVSDTEARNAAFELCESLREDNSRLREACVQLMNSEG